MKRLVLLAWLSAIVFAWPVPKAPIRTAERRTAAIIANESCGAQSLRILCRLEGIVVPNGAIETLLGPMPEGGHSMSQLIIAARGVGLELDGFWLSGQDARPDGPMTAHLDLPGIDHFVALYPVLDRADLMEILDPAGESFQIDFRELVNLPCWSGAVLIPKKRFAINCLPIRIIVVAVAACVFATYRPAWRLFIRSLFEASGKGAAHEGGCEAKVSEAEPEPGGPGSVVGRGSSGVAG